MILTNENYFSQEAKEKFCGVSEFKDFIGTLGRRACEAKAHSKYNGTWKEEKSTALLVGSYVDAHFEGTLNTFKAQNPDLFKRDGGLKADYVRAEEVIQRIERDPYFMDCMSGEKQVIMTAEIFGVPWKIKIDSYHPDKAIVDLKVMKSITEMQWVKDYGKMNFIEYWGYDIQAAIYQKVVELNTGKKLPFLIAAASKEEFPNIEVIIFDQKKLDDTLSIIEASMPRYLALKRGEAEPDRCDVCDYCRHTKKLSKAIHYTELIENV